MNKYVYEYPRYKITCDVACVTSDNEILIIKRGIEPGKGQWALPGGNLEPHETLLECAQRELKEETGIVASLVPVANFDAIDRAPGDRCICVLFKAELSTKLEVHINDDAADYQWIKAEDVCDIDFAFDIREMIDTILK